MTSNSVFSSTAAAAPPAAGPATATAAGAAVTPHSCSIFLMSEAISMGLSSLI